jgi:predicted nucleotidyltransferase
MVKLLENNLESICRLFDAHHVQTADIFGSALSSDFTKDSDIDILVTFKDSIELLDYSDNYFDLKMKLEDLLSRRVDLVSARSLKNPVLVKAINESKVNVYAAQSA